MTEKIYIQDPYVKEFEAFIQKIEGNNVVLNKTAFYPESGGQAGDTGYIDKTRVIDTRYAPDRQIIIHITSGEPSFEEGNKIKGIIDWSRRYRIMRLHAASHIMEHFLYKVFGELKLSGTHVNEKHDSSTYETDKILEPEKLQRVNDLANAFISKGYEINRWEDSNRPGWMYWKADEIEIPCGGTHPKNTKEIGAIIIKRKSGGSGKEKIITSLVD